MMCCYVCMYLMNKLFYYRLCIFVVTITLEFVILKSCYDVSYYFIDFFFFMQKMAYDMRISDWSSDVCSSDLHEVIAVYENGRMFPGSITVVDITGQDTVETSLVWEDGDADRSMKPIPGTLVRTPWGGDQAAQFLVDFYELDGTPHDLDPRHALGRVVDRFPAEGLTPVLAVELEFYLVYPRRARDGSIRPASQPGRASGSESGLHAANFSALPGLLKHT